MKDIITNWNFVVWTRIVIACMLTVFALTAYFIAYNAEGYIMCIMPSLALTAIFILIGQDSKDNKQYTSISNPFRITR